MVNYRLLLVYAKGQLLLRRQPYIMAQSWRCWVLNLCSVSLLAMGGAIPNERAIAQITPDGTLGVDESSVVKPNVSINGITTDRIDGGAIRGATQDMCRGVQS